MLSPTLLSALRDPERNTPLQLAADGSKLLSDDGGRSWKIISDIPRFVTDEHLESFGHQWTHFDVAHNDEDRATFAAKTGVSISDLAGMRILDAGCGGGRYAKVCGEAGATVFGADHTRAVDKAAQLCGQLANVQFVQADLKHLRFDHEYIEFVFARGGVDHVV